MRDNIDMSVHAFDVKCSQINETEKQKRKDGTVAHPEYVALIMGDKSLDLGDDQFAEIEAHISKLSGHELTFPDTVRLVINISLSIYRRLVDSRQFDWVGLANTTQDSRKTILQFDAMLKSLNSEMIPALRKVELAAVVNYDQLKEAMIQCEAAVGQLKHVLNEIDVNLGYKITLQVNKRDPLETLIYLMQMTMAAHALPTKVSKGNIGDTHHERKSTFLHVVDEIKARLPEHYRWRQEASAVATIVHRISEQTSNDFITDVLTWCVVNASVGTKLEGVSFDGARPLGEAMLAYILRVGKRTTETGQKDAPLLRT
jgi:hypothetical protein